MLNELILPVICWYHDDIWAVVYYRILFYRSWREIVFNENLTSFGLARMCKIRRKRGGMIRFWCCTSMSCLQRYCTYQIQKSTEILAPRDSEIA